MFDRLWKRFDAATATHVFAAAFLIALVAGLVASIHSRRIIGGEGHDGYLELAQNLVAGHGYVFVPNGHKVFHRPPLYPLLLTPGAALSKSACRTYIIALNSALLAGTATLLFQFAQTFFGARAGCLASAILVLNPFLLYGIKNPVSALCQMFVFFLVVVSTWRIATSERPSLISLIFYTLALWAAAMSHGVMLPISLLILGGLLIVSMRGRTRVSPLQILAIGAGLILLISPWTLRNYRVTGLFIPVAGNTGLAYFAGNAHWGITQPARRFDEFREDSEFRHAGLPLERRREWMKFYGMADPQAEKLIDQRAKEHLLAHPSDFAKKFFLNAFEYYFPMIFAVFPPPGSPLEKSPFTQRLKDLHSEAVALSLYHFVLVASAAIGFFQLRRQLVARGLALYLLALWIVYAVSYFPFLTFVGHSLYTYGTLPIVAFLAAICWLNPKPTANARLR